MESQTFQPRRARDQVRAILREMILAGDVVSGERLDEIGLANRVGASRTPIREALIALEEEGLVCSRPNHGFAVTILDAQLVRELYPILGALEGAAVETSGDALRRASPELLALCARLARETKPARRYALDREFHRLLTAHCGNERLLQLLDQHWNHARRIDGGATRGMANHQGSVKEHIAIVRAIKRGDFHAAAQLLRDHWRGGIDVVLRWMGEKS